MCETSTRLHTSPESLCRMLVVLRHFHGLLLHIGRIGFRTGPVRRGRLGGGLGIEAFLVRMSTRLLHVAFAGVEAGICRVTSHDLSPCCSSTSCSDVLGREVALALF